MFIAHPLFGHVSNPSTPGMNNYGFPSKYSYPYFRSPEEIVVGIYGGSVAAALSLILEHQLNISASTRALRSCGRRFVVLNFAAGAMRQPQQLTTFIHSKDWIDLAINVDGHNELTIEANGGLPPEFPAFSFGLYFLNEQRVSDMRRIFYLRRLQAYLARWPFETESIQKSHVLFWAFGFFDQVLRNWISLINNKLEREIDQTMIPPGRKYTEDPNGTILWTKNLLMQYQLAQAAHIPIFFFLQPTQYTRTLKPMSESEKKRALSTASQIFDKRIEQFERGQEAVAELNRKGVPIYSLRDLFLNESDEIFIDDCCHLNSQGNELLARKIVQQISTPKLLRQLCNR